MYGIQKGLKINPIIQEKPEMKAFGLHVKKTEGVKGSIKT